MTKKINSKLLISLCLVVVLVVCALSMIACNKKKGDSSNNGTTTEAVTGETVIAVDNVAENRVVNIPAEYTVISPSASFTKVASIIPESGNEYWIVKDGTTTTIQGTDPAEVLDNYYIYDLVNNEKVYGPFTTFAIAPEYYGPYTYKYIYTATAQYKQSGIYKYIGQVVDVSGNYLSTTLHGDSNVLYYEDATTNFFTNIVSFNTHVSISASYATDAQFGPYTTATFVSNQGVFSTQMISLKSYEIQPLDDDFIIPTFDAGNKYQEKTPVPGMNGYYYVIDRSKNTIFFYNSYASSTPSSSLYFDFGDIGIDGNDIQNHIMGGKVVLYGGAALPTDSTDFDYYYVLDLGSGFAFTAKAKNAMYVFDIKSGEINRILSGYVIGDEFKLFTANNGTLYISVELRGISADKIPSASAKYYVVDTEGNILVSTPELFDPSRIDVRFSNGGYAYHLEGNTHVYILDKYLNTITKADKKQGAENNAFLAVDESMRLYAIDLSGSIKNTNINANDFTSLDLIGDYIVGELNNGKLIAYTIGTANYRTIYDPATDTGFTMTYAGQGVYIKIQLVGTSYTFTFINCNGNQIGDAITGIATNIYDLSTVGTGLMIKIGGNYYHIA